MKKYLFRAVLAVLFLISVSAVYLNCASDTASFDLTGTWFGLAEPPQGAAFIELHAVHDTTTGAVTGTLYILSQQPDTAIITGTVSDNHFTGVATGIQCPADIDLDITNDGTALGGHAVGQVSANCAADFVYLSLYRDLPAYINVTGTWAGTHTSAQETGNFTMVLNQSGETVTGNIYSNDTNSISGRVFGSVFAGSFSGSACPILILMEGSTNSMNGIYASAGDSLGGCIDRGTVTANRIAKVARK